MDFTLQHPWTRQTGEPNFVFFLLPVEKEMSLLTSSPSRFNAFFLSLFFSHLQTHTWTFCSGIDQYIYTIAGELWHGPRYRERLHCWVSPFFVKTDSYDPITCGIAPNSSIPLPIDNLAFLHRSPPFGLPRELLYTDDTLILSQWPLPQPYWSSLYPLRFPLLRTRFSHYRHLSLSHSHDYQTYYYLPTRLRPFSHPRDSRLLLIAFRKRGN